MLSLTNFAQSFQGLESNIDYLIIKKLSKNPSQRLQVQALSLTCIDYGEPMFFDCYIVPEDGKTQPTDIRVYMTLEQANRSTLYQLDFVQTSRHRPYIWYSCKLVLRDVGSYQARFFAKNLSGTVFQDSISYDFEVRPQAFSFSGSK